MTNETITIIHLSDIHMPATLPPELANRADIVSAAVRSKLSKRPSRILILISGDIAFSGSKEEYANAKAFIDSLATNLQQTADNVTVFLVPGNHDCNFSAKAGIREALLKSIAGSSQDVAPDIAAVLLEAQTDFRDFAKTFGCTWPDNSPVCIHTISSDIEIVGINSAWMSSKRETAGTLRISPQSLPTLTSTPALRIAAMHHPLNWLHHDDARRLRAWLEANADAVFFGHEHVADVRQHGSLLKGDRILISEGAVFWNRAESISKFSIIDLNILDHTIEGSVRVWQHSASLARYVAESTAPIKHQGTRFSGRLHFSDAFDALLTEVGMPLRHPKPHGKLLLTDLYVWPDLTDSPRDAATQVVRIGSDLHKDSGLVVVHGQEHSGRSSLAKQLVRQLHDSDRTPIFVTEISPHNKRPLADSIRESIHSQYGISAASTIEQLPPSKVSLIIDDADFLVNDNSTRGELLDLLNLRYDQIVLFVDSTTIQTQAASTTNGILATSTIYEILPFGHLLIDRLVRRWLALNPTIDDASERDVRLRRYVSQIRQLLANDLVPPYPFFLLAMLSFFDSNASETKNSAGSVGNLYQSLVTSALHQAGYATDEIETIFTYLCELARRIKTSGIDGHVSASNVSEWHKAHCNSFDVTLELSKTLTDLAAGDILTLEHGDVYFKYPFLYYYFMARWYRDNKASAQNEINSLLDSLHDSESGNIVLFLCHLDKDPSMVDRLVAIADSIFHTVREFDFASDGVIAGAGSLSTHDGNKSDETREKALAQEDRVNRKSRQRTTSSSNAEHSADNDFRSMLAAARVIEVLGLVLKNFYGSMVADTKVSVARAILSLGWRSAGNLRDILSTPTLKEWQEVADHVGKRRGRILDGRTLRDTIMFMVVDGTIAMSAQALAHRGLLVTLERVEKQLKQGGSPGPATPSGHADRQQHLPISSGIFDLEAAIVHVAAALSSAENIPDDKVYALNSRLKKKSMPHALLRRIVWRHLQMYKCVFQKRQKLCAKLDIEVKEQRFLNPHTRR